MLHNKKQLPLFVDNTILPTGKFHVSYSEIYDHLSCSHRHKLKHIDKLGTFTGSLHTEFGTAIHDTLEEFIRGEIKITEEVITTAVRDIQVGEELTDNYSSFEANKDDDNVLEEIRKKYNLIDEADPRVKNFV